MGILSSDGRYKHHVMLKDSLGYELGLTAAVSRGGGEPERSLKLLSRTPIDRTAIKTSQGDTEYSDWKPPYYAMKQDDLSGGRGSDDLTKDRSRYYNSGGLNTRRGGFVHLQGQEQLSGLLRKGGQLQPLNMSEPVATDVAGANYGLAWCTKVLPAANGDYDQVWIWSHVDPSNTQSSLKVRLYDGADDPWETPLTTAAFATKPAFAPGWHVLTLASAVTLTAANGVWVSIGCGGGNALEDTYGTEEIALDADQTADAYRMTDNDPSITYAAADAFPVRILAKTTPSFGRFFEYKQSLYYVQKVGATVKLWINGYRGTLTSGAVSSGTDTAQTFTTNALAGAVFKVIGGTGINETQRWRRIISNTATATSFSDEDGYFSAALDGTTEYVILGTNYWTEISGHGLTNITDVWVGNKGVVYFAQGSTAAMRRMREYNNAGTWTREFAADSTNQANFLTEVGTNIWRAQNTTGAVASAPAQAWGTDLTFATDIPCGDSTSYFTGLEAYTDDSGAAAPFVFKEEIVGFIQEDTFTPLKIKEMSSLRSEKNGRAHLVHDTFLYYSFNNGLERFYNPVVSDIGPDREEGMPTSQQGPIVSLCGYPGGFFAGIDGGSTGYSTVLFKGDGWHEEYTGAYGQRLFSIFSQPIPGKSAVDRLWIGVGGDIVWVPMPSESPNPLNDDNMLYRAGGMVQFSTVTTELKTVKKYISSLRAIFQDALPDYMTIYYRADDDPTWNNVTTGVLADITEDATTVRYQFAGYLSGGTPAYGLGLYSVKWRFHLFTEDRTETPVMLAWVMELLARIDSKYAYTIPFVLEGTAQDPARDLLNVTDAIPDGATKLAKLIEWAAGGPLYMTSEDPRFNNKIVLLLPFTESLVEYTPLDGRRVYLGQLTLQDA